MSIDWIDEQIKRWEQKAKDNNGKNIPYRKLMNPHLKIVSLLESKFNLLGYPVSNPSHKPLKTPNH